MSTEILLRKLQRRIGKVSRQAMGFPEKSANFKDSRLGAEFHALCRRLGNLTRAEGRLVDEIVQNATKDMGDAMRQKMEKRMISEIMERAHAARVIFSSIERARGKREAAAR